MKNRIFILSIFLLGISLLVSAQSKKDLSQEVTILKVSHKALLDDIELLKKETDLLNKEIDLLKQQLAQIKTAGSVNEIQQVVQEKVDQKTETRCKATTAAGKQCSRNADPGSDYCWQHKTTYEPNNTPSNAVSTPKVSGSGSSGTTGAGRVIHTGPRGGKYYINSKGNKVYVK